MQHLKRFFLVTALAVFCLQSCKENEPPKNLSDELFRFREYIADATHGTISTYGEIQVSLRQPVSAWSDGQGLKPDLLLISPKIPGKLVALNSQTLSFVPDQPFEQNTLYRFDLDLGKLIPKIPKEFKTFSFEIKTIKQEFIISSRYLQSYSKDWQYLESSLKSADKMPLPTALKLVRASQNGKALKVKFDESIELGTEFLFSIDSIHREVDDSKIVVEWDGNPFKIDSKGSEEIVIPGKNNFSVIKVNMVDNESQYVEINFSDPLKKNQNFEGLVSLQGSKNPKIVADGSLLKVYPDQRIKGIALLELFQGIESTDGYKLKQIYSENIAFEQIKPAVRLLSNGTLLPSSDKLKINFEAVNLKAVNVTVYRIFESNVLQFLQDQNMDGDSNLRYVSRPIVKKAVLLENKFSGNTNQWNAYAIDISELITPEPGAVYRVEFSFGKKYSDYKCDSAGEVAFSLDKFEDFKSGTKASAYWNDPESYYYEDEYYDDYDWRQRDNPCDNTYYYNQKIATNILATNLGLTIKKGVDGTYYVSVTDLLTTQPLANAKVTFYNLQQQAFGSVVTDQNGFSNFKNETTAAFAVAERDRQKTYARLTDGNALSVSKFDVSGSKIQKGLKGYLFGERGVWRPGDTLFLSFLLNDKTNPLPANHPVRLELIDPYGKTVSRQIKSNAPNNFYNFTVTTSQDAPTGNWFAKVSVGGAVFSERVRIETIKPNRLKIKANFDDEILTATKNIAGNLEVFWLHGAVAKNLKSDIQGRFNQTKTVFSGFPNYVFDDPARTFSAEEQNVFSGSVDENGKTVFQLKPQLVGNAPGLLQATFTTKVYEPGGDFSTDVFTKTYSPYSTYIGLRVPEGDAKTGMLVTDKPYRFEIAAVDLAGKPKAVKNLKVAIYKVNWRWWWDNSSDNLSSYNSDTDHEKVFEKTVNTNASGKGSFDFQLKYPGWGRYLVRIEDETGGHATGQTIYIDWPGWAGKSQKRDPSAATMLIFSTDKKKYNVGENAVITFPSSDKGRALVTVENGTEVLESFWIIPQKGETKFELPIKDTYAPNVYLNISLLQPHASTANDLPIRMYGIVPIAVENPQTKLEPLVAMPKVLRPEETIELEVKEKTGKPMVYSIAIVDEGLLDLTRFKTPNPWDVFYAKEALGIKTWDVFDDVIGAFGGRINQVFSIGGDTEAAGAKNKKANRFKPMVVYLGPFSLERGKSKKHSVKIPKYIGSVRTMVVAADNQSGAYGFAEQASAVRKPLMVLSSLPRKITPGEKVILPVTVFAMENSVKDVTVKVRNSVAYQIKGASSKQISFSQPDEKMVYFELEVADFSGIGKVMVEASGNGQKASYEVEIDVVNPNPVTTESESFVIGPNSNQSIDLKTFGIEGSNTARIEISTLPAMNFNGRLEYLIQYPHGCIEQVTSSVFPQLLMPEIIDLTVDKKQQIQQNIETAIKKLNDFQRPEGGFSYWQGQKSIDEWGTSYAGHFLIEAANKGYVLPLGFKTSWVKYQQNAARNWRKTEYSSDLTQAYRLYTLALAGSPDISSMNRLRETPGISNEAKLRLAATYALIGQKSASETIFRTANIDFQPIRADYFTYGSVDRNRAMGLETLVLLNRKKEAQELAKKIAENLNGDNWLSTQSVAYSLVSMSKFAKLIGGKNIEMKLDVNGKTSALTTPKTLIERQLTIKTGDNRLNLGNTQANTLFVNVVRSGVLPVGQEKTVQKNLSLSVAYKGRDGKPIDVEKLSQGSNFVAEITVTNKKGDWVKNIALTEILPSGWEIINTRFTDFGSFGPNKADYTDIRDDRVNFYFDLKKYESKTFRILLNASYLGTYYLPGIQCEAMYDNDYLFRSPGRWVEVVQ